MSDNKNGNPAAQSGALGVVVAATIPPALAERFKAGNLRPVAVIFRQQTSDGIEAGLPVELPARPLLPVEVVAGMQRALSDGSVTVNVAFEIPEQQPQRPRIQRV